MTDQPDPQKAQNDFFETMKKMMEQVPFHVQPEAEKVKTEEEKPKASRKESLHFKFKPKEVKKHLDRFVIKQEEAKRVLATAVCDHYHHIANCEGTAKCKDYTKQNILMLGPTGVGKTYLIRSLSELIGVPFTKADATKFSETGYVGGDVEDLVRDLVQKADGDIGLAECGMIYLDEIDKIASASNLQGRDVSGTGVQRGLLKIMEETEIALRNPQDVQSQIQAMMEFQQKGKISKPIINTRHILFIVSGAFGKLPEIIEKRRKAASIGFVAAHTVHPPKEELLKNVKTEDFMEYGFEPEFIGRLPVRVSCEPLLAEDLYAVLKTSEGSILKQYEASFGAYGIKARFEDAALWEISKQAASEGTGARGLVTICEKILRDFKYELPSSQVKEFVVTAKVVRAAKEELDRLLQTERSERAGEIEKQIREFETRFFDKNAIRIELDRSAVQEVLDKVLKEDRETGALLDQLFSNYAYGLGLIQKKSPLEKFVLTAEAVKNPHIILENWIKQSYERS